MVREPAPPASSSAPPSPLPGNNPLDRLADGIFVGRDNEMTNLHAAIEEALTSQSRIVLLAGDPGIGKTRTAQEIAKRAQHRGMHVLWGRCYEGSGAPAYWPWLEIIRRYVQARTADELLAVMGAGAADIAQVSSAVQDRLGDLPSPPRLGPEQERFRLFDSVTTFLQKAATTQPLMLVIDDLHWADPASLMLLEFAARGLDATRLVIIGTYRDQGAHGGQPLLRMLAELARSNLSSRITLGGLSQPEVGDYIKQTTGQEPGAALVASIFRHTEGNPFFVGEVVRLLAIQGRLTTTDTTGRLGIPAAVREVIGRRLERLSAECHDLLATAAVIGREFRLNVLSRAIDVAPQRVLELLDEAVAARVAREGTDAGHYSFVHTLIRETLYSELATSRRLSLHQRVGEALEALHPHAEPVLSELAYHFGEGAPIGEVRKAVDYARRAGERAARLLAFEDAASCYQRALQALALAPSADEQERGDLLLALAHAQWNSGKTIQAKETFQKTAEVARQIGARDLLARAALGPGWEPIHGYAGRDAWTTDRVFIPLLEEALAALGDDDTALRARVLAQLALWEVRPSARQRRMAMGREAVELARRIGDPTTLVAVLHSAYRTLYEPGNLPLRMALAAEEVAFAQQSTDESLIVRARLDLLQSLLQGGDIASADVEIDTNTRLAEATRSPNRQWRAATHRAMRALLAGRFDESEALAWHSLEFAQRVQELAEAAAQIFGIQMFELRRQQGRISEVEGSVAAFAGRTSVPAWRAATALVYAELGRVEEARCELDRLAIGGFADVPADELWLPTLGLLVDVCAVLGDSRYADVLYSLLCAFAGECIMVGDVVCFGSVSRFLGMLATMLRRWEDGCVHFESAIATHVRIDARPWLAHTQCNYAAMLFERHAPGDQVRASELLSAAMHTARALGMKALLERALALELQVQGADSSRPPTAVEVVAIAPRNNHSDLAASLRQEGDYWALTYESCTCRLKDSKGLQYLAHLLRQPGQEFHALDLVRGAGGGNRGSDDNSPRRGGHDTGLEVLDTTAKAAYRGRLAELREELEEAEQFNDTGRGEGLRAEIEALTEQLAAAVGLGGRDREMASATERARSTVTQRIKTAIKRIAEHQSALADHLARRLKTGNFCSYSPDPVRPIRWQID